MNHKRILTAFVTVLAAASIFLTSMASASDYVALKAGVYSPSTSRDLDTYSLDSKSGFAGEIAVGHYFLPMLALELGAGYFESKGSPLAQPGELKLKVVPLVATGKVLLPLGPFEPYGLFGIGAYITDLDTHSGSTLKGSTEITYGLHAGAGLNINLPENLFVGVEGKYLWAEPSFGGQHIKLDGFITTAVIGLKY